MLKDVVIAGKTYAKFSIPETEGLDDIAMKVIRQDTPDFLLPIKTMNIDGEIEIRFEISEGTRLSYLPESMLKKDFIILLENMIRPFKNCGDWFLDYHNFHLDKNYIMVGKDCTEVKYAYIPTVQYTKSEEEVLDFFRDYILNINLKDDPTYVMGLYRFIKDKNVTLLSMLDYIVRGGGNSSVEAAQVQPAQAQPMQAQPVQMKNSTPVVDSVAMPIVNRADNRNNINTANQPQMPKESQPAKPAEIRKEFGKDNVKDDLINNLFGDIPEEPARKEKAPKKAKEAAKEKSSKPLFGGMFGGNKAAEKKAQTPNVQPQMPMGNVPYMQQQQPVNVAPMYVETDATFIGDVEEVVTDGSKLMLEVEEDRGYHVPKYIEIDLGKGYATVGRFDKAGVPQSDYNFDATLSFISRRHFRVERSGEQFAIIDLGSANGTFLNNQQLVPNMPYPVNSGDQIVLSKSHRITYRVR